MLHVEQETPGSDETVLQLVLKADLEREFLLKEEKTIKDQLDANTANACVFFNIISLQYYYFCDDLNMIDSISTARTP